MPLNNADQRTISDLIAVNGVIAHDMKNSLSILLDIVHGAVEHCGGSQCNGVPDLAQMEYEIRRINHNVVKMLTLFRLQQGNRLLNLDLHPLQDLLQELMADNSHLLPQKKLDWRLECDPTLHGYFDRNLMMGVVGNAINNAIRYTHSALLLSARRLEDGSLEILVEDDGEGFSEALLEDIEQQVEQGEGFLNSNTGLGIYFSRRVLELHCDGERCGAVAIGNGSALGGGWFRVLLP